MGEVAGVVEAPGDPLPARLLQLLRGKPVSVLNVMFQFHHISQIEALHEN